MTRPLIVATLCPLATAYLTGCGVVCRGPACVEEWDIGRALVLAGASERAESDDAVASAEHVWFGTEVEGADWTLDGGDGELLIGTPGSSQVWIVPQDGEGSLVGTPWTDGTSFGFGRAIARGAEATWIGNPEADLARGALYRYPSGAVQPDLVITGASTGDRLGERVWMCGDLDRDGIEDVAASLPWLASPDVPALAGGVAVILSTELALDPNRPPGDLGRLYWGAGAGDALGSGVACDRDLDGDAFPDLAIGAPYVGAEDDGAVYVLSGETLPPSGLAAEAARATIAGTAAGWLGFDVSTIREARTGRILMTAGAPGAGQGAGAVWIVEVTGQEASLTARFEADVTAAGFHVGRVVTHGDRDGDGKDDLIIGAPDWKEGKNGYDAGRVFVLYGGPPWSGVAPLVADTTLTATQPFARIGRGIRAMDLDGDGADELLLPNRTAILP